jgi:hypothetical protein
MARESSLIPVRIKRLVSSPKYPEWLWGPPTFLFNGNWETSPKGRVAGVELYLHFLLCLHCVPRDNFAIYLTGQNRKFAKMLTTL